MKITPYRYAQLLKCAEIFGMFLGRILVLLVVGLVVFAAIRLALHRPVF